MAPAGHGYWHPWLPGPFGTGQTWRNPTILERVPWKTANFLSFSGLRARKLMLHVSHRRATLGSYDMNKVGVRVPDTHSECFNRRALGASLSLRAFVRSALAPAADLRERGIPSSQSELLASGLRTLTMAAMQMGVGSSDGGCLTPARSRGDGDCRNVTSADGRAVRAPHRSLIGTACPPTSFPTRLIGNQRRATSLAAGSIAALKCRDIAVRPSHDHNSSPHNQELRQPGAQQHAPLDA